MCRPALLSLSRRLQLFCSLISWFMFYCITRTLSNSFECSLTMVALQLWPDTSGHDYPPTAASPAASALLKQYERRRRWALILAAIVFVVRPTSVSPRGTCCRAVHLS